METKHTVSNYTKRGYCNALGKFIEGHRVKECKLCHALYMREWRKTHPFTIEQRKKDSCRSYAGVYLRRGKIEKENCYICGSGNSQMHHDDYDKPLNIKWLCRKCHLGAHRLLTIVDN